MHGHDGLTTGSRRWRSVLTAALLLVAGCGTAASLASAPGTTAPGSPGTSASPTTSAPTGIDTHLTVGSQSGVAVIDPATGATQSAAPSGIASGDGTRWLTSTVVDPAGGTTRVAVFDPATAAEQSIVHVNGAWTAKVASTDGSAVALTPANPTHPGSYLAPPRLRTPIMIVRAGQPQPQIIELDGNFEPEAFTVDTAALFVLQFTPAIAPERYRVRRLDLATGVAGDVLDRAKAPQADMPGQARVQVRAPDGTALYTLYTVDAGHGHHDGPHAFVHVLDLKDQFAHCIDLPKPFGAAAQEVAALALTPDAKTLFAVDRAAGAVAALDLEQLTVRASAPIAALPNGGTVTAAAGTGNRLFVGTGTTLTTIDANDLREIGSLPLSQPATALYQSPASGRLYVATDNTFAVYDHQLRYQRAVSVPQFGTIVSVGPGAGPLPAQRETYECAC